MIMLFGVVQSRIGQFLVGNLLIMKKIKELIGDALFLVYAVFIVLAVCAIEIFSSKSIWDC